MGEHSGKKKIMFVINSLIGGGAEKVLVDIINSLSQDKYEMLLAVFQKKGTHLRHIPAYVKIYELKKLSRFSFLKLVIRLAILLRQVKPETVVSFMSYDNLIVVLAKMLSGSKAKIVNGEHEIVCVELKYARLKLLKRFLYGIFSKYSDVYIVPSQGVAECLRTLFHLRSEKIKVIHNPIDLDVINRLKGEEIGNIPFGKYILAAGRLSEQKGYDYLLKAYAFISNDLEEKLVIIGEGEFEGELKSLAKDLGIEKKVLFLGFQDNPYKFMRHASLFVLSSLWESFSLVVVEAMASGVPVVATDCPVGPREIIAHGVNGILVPPGDEKSLAKAMSDLLKDEDLKKKLIEAGEIRAKDFDKEKIIMEYEKIL